MKVGKGDFRGRSRMYKWIDDRRSNLTIYYPNLSRKSVSSVFSVSVGADRSDTCTEAGHHKDEPLHLIFFFDFLHFFENIS
jgi:hypothetical protein